MQVKNVVATFRAQIADAKANGLTEVSLDSLSGLVDLIEKDGQASPEGVNESDVQFEKFKAELSAWQGDVQRNHDADMQMLRATIEMAMLAVKSSLLINGGAAVAFLAFVGTAWGNISSISAKSALSSSLEYFAWGVFSAGVASVMAYFSQAGFGGEFGSGKLGNIVGHGGRWIGAALVIGSFVVFGSKIRLTEL